MTEPIGRQAHFVWEFAERADQLGYPLPGDTHDWRMPTRGTPQSYNSPFPYDAQLGGTQGIPARVFHGH